MAGRDAQVPALLPPLQVSEAQSFMPSPSPQLAMLRSPMRKRWCYLFLSDGISVLGGSLYLISLNSKP